MKISQLIKELQKMKDAHGDLRVIMDYEKDGDLFFRFAAVSYFEWAHAPDQYKMNERENYTPAPDEVFVWL